MEPGGEKYENHLKGAYMVPKAGASLLITDGSCYTLGAETAWLVSALPAAGSKPDFISALSGLGVTESGKVFDRLVGIGALRLKKKPYWLEMAGRTLAPRLRLISAGAQEKMLAAAGWGAADLARLMPGAAILAAVGAAWGLVALVGAQAGGAEASGAAVMGLVLLASLLHEAGHSAAAAASGIGLRPIGLSVYLIYPVFYTNVSGVDKLPLSGKILVDCGGFIAQGVGLLILLIVSVLSGSASVAAAARWIALIMLFNLNPLIRTDAYWLYHDLRAELGARSWVKAAHAVYLAAFSVFTVYFLWQAAGRAGFMLEEVRRLAVSPSYAFSGGYKAVLWIYFILVAVSGGLQRVKESGREWKKFAKEA